VLGTVDVVTRYLFEQRCYVTEHHSFDDRLSGRFFIRVEFRSPTVSTKQASAPAWPSAAKPSAWSSS
jgi:formyltetrahydrofolate deformylase